MAVQPPRNGTGRAASEKRVENNVAAVRRRKKDACQQGFRLLRRMRLAPVAFQPLGTGADWQLPVGPHLNIAIQRLHRLIIECMARGLRTCRPDQRLMRIGETAAAEIRHRIGLAPDNIVQDPEIQILENAAKTVNIVIAADHPQRAIRFQDAARFGKPGRREAVIGGK